MGPEVPAGSMRSRTFRTPWGGFATRDYITLISGGRTRAVARRSRLSPNANVSARSKMETEVSYAETETGGEVVPPSLAKPTPAQSEA